MPAAIQPDPSLIEVGNLYADVQSRAIWLGVDPAVDPNESILLSDIVAMMEADAAVLLEANDYTDTQILTRAPVVHTHNSGQITNFNAAVEAVVMGIPGFNWVAGMIMLWSGSLAEIGVGNLAGWALCDGGNGTPDLRDRFIIGAGNKTPGNINAISTIKTDVQGSHAHVIVGTGLTEAQLGSHAHVSTLGPWRFYGSTYGGGAPHAHSSYGPWRPGGGGLQHDTSHEGDTGVHESVRTGTTGHDGHHDHPCFVDMHVAVATDYRGGNQAHTHGCQSAGQHDHTLTAAQIRDVLPFYALAYIMKL